MDSIVGVILILCGFAGLLLNQLVERLKKRRNRLDNKEIKKRA